ncbi:hypothetical protein EON64_16995 [archaeon]|nr:MAG: hypothetical protein EON64_16995 [archaeon]
MISSRMVRIIRNKRMDMELNSVPATVAAAIAGFSTLRTCLGHVDANLEHVIQLKDLDELESKLLSLEGAKADVALAFTIVSLYYVQLNMHSKLSKDHPIHELNNRIKSYVAKINDIAGSQSSQKRGNEDTDKEANKRLKVDKDAAERMIKHQIL